MRLACFATNELFTTSYIVGQIFAFAGYLLHFASYCLPKKTHIVVVECFSKALNIVSFVFLQSLAGMLANGIIILRGITVYFREKYQRSLIWCYVVLMVMLIVCGIFSYENAWSICAFVPMLITTTTTWFWGPQGIRIGQMIASVVYLAFQISLLNIVGIAMECVVFVICVVTFVLYKMRQKQSQEQALQDAQLQ